MKIRLLIILFFAAYSNICVAQPAVGSWTNTGPVLFPTNISGQVNGIGRVCQLKFHPSNSQKLYAVSASGGLFFSDNNGLTWKPCAGTDQLPQAHCSAICIDHTNDSILYLSTGDPHYYASDYGIWKSTDAGENWSLSNSGIATRMAIEILMASNNHNILVAATNDGIWKTTDAGANWIVKKTGGDFRSMLLKPGSNNVLYAVTSKEYYKSTDFGDTWTQISNGLLVPANNGGLRLAVSAADTNVVYIASTDSNGVIMRSSDGGQNFSVVYADTAQCIVCRDQNPASGSQGDYNLAITVNPQNANELLLVSHCVWRSTDGGSTWSKRTSWANECHTDMHDIKFNPYNNQQRFNSNDGGLWMSTDTNATIWVPRSEGLAATEIYHASQSPLIRQMINIGTQDNGELFYNNAWKCVRGNDWYAFSTFDYLPGANVYYLNNTQYAYDSATGKRRALQPIGNIHGFNSPYDATLGYQGVIEFLPGSPNRAFLGTDSLWSTTNLSSPAPTWSPIYTFPSPEAVKSIASCKADSNILYIVTNGSTVYRSDNALAASPTFTIINAPGYSYLSASLATNKKDTNLVYLTCGSQVFRSINKGATWMNITFNLPNYNILNIISDDYSTTERLFVCAGNYIYFKDNTSNIWTLATGIPSIARISDLMIYNDGTAASVLRASTYGRGVWETGINNNLPPVLDFVADKPVICPSDTVHFSKTIYGNYSSVIWSFPGGYPATSTADSPVIVYNNTGAFNVRLIAISPSGNDTLFKSGYIYASNGLGTPLQEGFEGASYLPAGWQHKSETTIPWKRVDTIGGFALSTHSIYWDNYNYDARGQHNRIITNQVNLNGVINAYATFDVAYAANTGHNDSLLVEVSSDCNKTFVPVYTKDTTTLPTTAGAAGGFFIPDASQWRKDTIWLNTYIGQRVSLAFNNKGHNGQAVYIDNVNLAITLSENNIKTESRLEVYPNPTTGIVYIKGADFKGANTTIFCYDVLGKLIRKTNTRIQHKAFSAFLDLADLATGIYELRIQTDAGESISRPVTLK